MNALLRKRLLRSRLLLLRWHAEQNERDFAWRREVREPYEVWLCEMMGQQTQASRIAEYLHRFLTKFPDVQALARASQRDVIKAWQGLGYNRRALHVHRAAKEIVERFNGIFPSNESDLRSLPGIGAYTASAILIFAFGKRLSAVDVNVSRVLTRISRRVRTTTDMLPIETVHEINLAILPPRQNRDWHEAIMDLGATICIKSRPKCSECPLNSCCLSVGLAKTNAIKTLPSSSEKQYFGQPKRIWRGRVLKLISNAPCTKRSLLKTLADDHGLTRSSAAEVLDLVLPSLVTEEFISYRNGTYALR